MNRHYLKTNRHEKGMATLVIILLLLFVATLVTLYTANSSIREQQVSANQYRADQALSAANAGLDYALAYYTKFTGPDADGDYALDALTVNPALLTYTRADGTTHTVSAVVGFTDGNPGVDRLHPVTGVGDGITDNDFLDRPHTLTSIGYSDDLSATRTIQVEVDIAGVIPNGGNPGFPLIAKGVAPTTGNFKIINRFSHATIWTGGGTAQIGSAETYVRDPPPNPQPANHADMVSYDKTGGADPDLVLHASYSKAGLNSDVIEDDDNLKNMTNDQFFQSFINEEKPTIRALAEGVGQLYDVGDYANSGALWTQLVTDNVRGIVWIDVPDNDEFDPGGTLPTIGSEQFPLSLFIDGDFDTGGTGGHDLEVIGLIYVIGDWESGGNFEVQGGIIVEGDVDLVGGPTIVYDNALYDGSLGVPPGGVASVSPGTWKDW